MQTYRLDLLDEVGKVESSREITCVDDEEALLRAATIGHPAGVVVWQGHRRVGDVRDGILHPRVHIT